MKLNNYLKKLQIDSKEDVISFCKARDISPAQFYRYTSDEYMDKITPLIASKICKSFHILPLELLHFDNSFSDEFIDKTEQYLYKINAGAGTDIYSRFYIEKMFNDFLSDYGFTNLDSSLKFELVNKEYHIISSYNDIRFPFLEKVNKFPDAIVEHQNGKKYLIFFFSPKHIGNKTTIYDSVFTSIHTTLLWMLSQISSPSRFYDNNFILLTTSEFIYNSITDSNNYMSGFLTNKGTDIYMGLCRTNRQYICKKITNTKIKDVFF